VVYRASPLSVSTTLRGLPKDLRLSPEFVAALDYARRIELYVPQFLAEVAVKSTLELPTVRS